MRINGATFDNFEDLHEFIQALKDLPPALPERAVPSSTSIEKLPDEQPYEAAAQAAYEAWELL